MSLWDKVDYMVSAEIGAAAERITKRLTEHAVRLAITRFDLLSFDPDARDEANAEDEIIQDLLNVALGEDTGCLDPDNLDETNCEVLYVGKELSNLMTLTQSHHDLEQKNARLLAALAHIRRAAEMDSNSAASYDDRHNAQLFKSIADNATAAIAGK